MAYRDVFWRSIDSVKNLEEVDKFFGTIPKDVKDNVIMRCPGCALSARSCRHALAELNKE